MLRNVLAISPLTLLYSILLNFRLLPFRKALCFPLLVHYRTNLHMGKHGGLELKRCHFGMVRIGLLNNYLIQGLPCKLHVEGRWQIGGETRIGRGTRILIGEGVCLKTGNEFRITGDSLIHVKTGG